jgi:hypothetical protein
MSSGDPIREGQILTGPLFSEPMRVETVSPNGPSAWTVGLVLRRLAGHAASYRGNRRKEPTASSPPTGTLKGK